MFSRQGALRRAAPHSAVQQRNVVMAFPHHNYTLPGTRMKIRLLLPVVFLFVALILPSQSAVAGQGSSHEWAGPDRERWVFAYAGRLSRDRMVRILTRLEASFEDSEYYAGGMGWHLGTSWEHLRWEAELQAGRHTGDQDHWEFVGVIVARWTRFPWDHYMDTSFAVGEGQSYATNSPVSEERKGTQRLLNYLLVEVSVTMPGSGNLDVFTRLHHRSAVFGLYGGASGGSNVVGIGTRYRF